MISYCAMLILSNLYPICIIHCKYEQRSKPLGLFKAGHGHPKLKIKSNNLCLALLSLHEMTDLPLAYPPLLRRLVVTIYELC